MSEAVAKIDAERIRWFKQVLSGLHEPRASKCVFHGHLSACVCAPRDEMLAALDALLAAQRENAELRHAIWHALDDSEDRNEEGRLITKLDGDELCRLVPEEPEGHGS